MVPVGRADPAGRPVFPICVETKVATMPFGTDIAGELEITAGESDAGDRPLVGNVPVDDAVCDDAGAALVPVPGRGVVCPGDEDGWPLIEIRRSWVVSPDSLTCSCNAVPAGSATGSLT